ncbi:MAG TPA: YkgJ family cysteine cluster protein [Anaerolineae bacterium]|nr:YkgJ family cysteine cluster protein [Anaerolineae bacterium]
MSHAALQAAWWQRLEKLHQRAEGASGLACAARCTARCCPHAAMATQPPAYTVSHVMIMLPFEMDYILAKTALDPARLRKISVEIAPGLVHEIGFANVATPCPFLTADFRCGAYRFRPLDCRSFPLTPVFGMDGALDFRLTTTCPSLDTFAHAYQEQLKTVWRDLLPHLSMAYREVYNQL